ncbi:hypothetical protein FB451DRAFT_1376104 [Mycena latifolia]|nr:hypothetical protein FB451DRAFT_1376104 [Mycena latifolia]
MPSIVPEVQSFSTNETSLATQTTAGNSKNRLSPAAIAGTVLAIVLVIWGVWRCVRIDTKSNEKSKEEQKAKTTSPTGSSSRLSLITAGIALELEAEAESLNRHDRETKPPEGDHEESEDKWREAAKYCAWECGWFCLKILTGAS